MKPAMACLCGLALALGLAGCATTGRSEAGAPKVKPDEEAWKRKPVPLPPVYMTFRSGSGDQWTMVTPLYWQVEGADRASHLLFPLASWGEDRPAGTSGGHALTYFWGRSPEKSHHVLFPLAWHFDGPQAETSLVGPVYTSREKAGRQRQRTVVFPWLWSRETDGEGYDYWGVLGRLVGYEKQVIGGERKERLWLLFLFPIATR